MDFLTTRKFRSKLYPEVEITMRVVTYGRRMEIFETYERANGKSELRSSEIIWNALIEDFEGITINGVKPSIETLFREGPMDLADEVGDILLQDMTQLKTTDASDEAIIAAAREKIAEAEARMTARKNSEPQSSGPTPGVDIRTAASAKATPTRPGESEPGGTVRTTPA